jgi:hypothetical protein
VVVVVVVGRLLLSRGKCFACVAIVYYVGANVSILFSYLFSTFIKWMATAGPTGKI